MIRNMQTAALLRKTTTPNEYNEQIEKWEVIGDIECFIYTSTGETSTLNDVISIHSTHTGLTKEKEVREGDKILYDAETYTVKFITPTRRQRVMSLELDRNL